MNIKHRWISIFDFETKKKKRKKIVTSINIDDFPIAIDNDFFIDYYRLLSIC